ncbi:hypothetical protein [Desulfococcus multivorans]|uniref:hypothetical protein n=2 Tax=Desulfococcus multivorans TaxID=897 RepID=UPI0008A67F77|nr:hypothetical protein [Desulfococcus multivorans]AOY57278.1 uncharacterized protein Dmul_05030 [Desulfococcus multivorans]MDX9818560.1 hypothetical protein [Desulfococcus multivorans]
MFKLLTQIIAFAVGTMSTIPFRAFSAMPFLSALRAAGHLPAFLAHIRQKPFAANTAGALSGATVRHCNFSMDEYLGMKLQSEFHGLKTSFENGGVCGGGVAG